MESVRGMAARAVERMLTMTREVVMRMTRRTTTRSGGTRKEPQLEGSLHNFYKRFTFRTNLQVLKSKHSYA